MMIKLDLILGMLFATVASLNAGAAMVSIPAGIYQMGDAFGEGHENELPVHSVSVSAFYMDATEVTKAEWDAVYRWAIGNGYAFDNVGSGKAPDHPVHTVNWYDCVKWANARSERDGLTPCYTHADGIAIYRKGTVEVVCNWNANGFRLPTEAQWEKAARGGAAGKRFSWSDSNRIAHSRANYYAKNCINADYDEDHSDRFHPDYDQGGYPFSSPVGSFPANDFGLYDMTGNLYEWCWDWSDNDYYASSPATNPCGPSTGAFRIWRGGYWFSQAYYSRVSLRLYALPDYEFTDLGFRLVRNAPEVR